MNEIENAIAITGISCKFPKAENKEAYWENIKNGIECLETLSTEHLEEMGVPSKLLAQDNYIKRCPEIKDIDKFDADFFKVSPKEASYMDPQQRLMLEKAWEAIEDAGYQLDDKDKKVGVFASTSASSYFLENLMNNRNFLEEAGGMKAVLHGLDKDHLATKIAYKLNLTGPAVTVQSACSSSMVATIMACQSLLTYQCDMALAGGVTVNVPQPTGYIYEKGSIMSQDGYCRPFDEEASGTVFGSGVGCVVLKRLEEAIEDNDRIYAVIRGFAINNDGNDKVGYTAPAIKGQMDVINEALEFSQIDPSTMDYVEAHGTGTIMGDPIEVEALSKVYERYTDKKGYCGLGSVKANVGHLNVASGIAGIIKGALAAYYQVIPPLVNLRKENSKINFQRTPFYLPTQWKAYRGMGPMRVGVSSFGIGGTNGHVILENYSKEERPTLKKEAYLLPLSGRDDEGLRNVCSNLLDFLKDNASIDLGDVERTLQVGRKAFDCRTAFVVEDIKDLRDQLAQLIQGGDRPASMNSDFERGLSSGNKYHWAAIRKMYDIYPEFKYQLEKALEQIEGLDISHLFNKEDEQVEINTSLSMAIKNALRNTLEALGVAYEGVKEQVENGKEVSLQKSFLISIASWWEAGNKVQWEKLVNIKRQNHLSLPNYPFKRKSYWIYKDQQKKKDIQEIESSLQITQHSRPDLETTYVVPENELQERLINMWHDLLGIEGIGIHDDFFELGGHSLMATQIITRIKDELLIELEMDELFECPTVAKLADKITQKLNDFINQMDAEEIAAYLEMEND